MIDATRDDLKRSGSLSTAYRAMWVAVAFDFLAVGVGFDLDRRWHAMHPFEDFFSPPRIFIYWEITNPAITGVDLSLRARVP